MTFLLGDDYSKSTRDNAVSALLETFRYSPIGSVLKQGIPIPSGNSYKFSKQGWNTPDAVAILYALYMWAEATGRYSFTLGQMASARGNSEAKGVDPVSVFGINPDRFKSILQDISLQFDKYIRTTFVADSGDPFSTCQQYKIAPYFKLLEKKVLKHFDYLAIPTSLAIDAYKELVPLKKIKIIPQGFNFEIKNNFPPISKNEIPHFAYAGVFYEGIRNPIFLFDYLAKLNNNFKFYLFLREKSPFTAQLLDTYSDKLKGKIIVRYGLEREKLLIELRKMDFLINIGNTTTVQVPSKIIDYALVDRPYVSFNELTFDKTIFNELLRGDYRNADKIPDLENYNIVNVAKQFLSLVAK